MPASSVLNANNEQFLVTNTTASSRQQLMHSNQYSNRSSANASSSGPHPGANTYYNSNYSQYYDAPGGNGCFSSHHSSNNGNGYIDDSLAYSFASQVSLSSGAATNSSSSKSINIPSHSANNNSGGGNLSAIEEIMTLRGLKTSQNVTESVPVPSSEHVAEIVGRQGCKIKALRAKTNTYIKTPIRGEAPMFVITGRKEDVLTAKREIQLAADHFSQIRARRGTSASGASQLGGSGGGGGSISPSADEQQSSMLNNSKTPTPPMTAPGATQLSPKLLHHHHHHQHHHHLISASSSSSSASSSSSISPPVSSVLLANSVLLSSNSSGDSISPKNTTPTPALIECPAVAVANQSPVSTSPGLSAAMDAAFIPQQQQQPQTNATAAMSASDLTLTLTRTSATSLLPGQIVKKVSVPYQVVGLVVGPKGSTIKRIQQNTNTYIVTPSRDSQPVFEIQGMPDNVEAAKVEIENYILLRTTTAQSSSSSSNAVAANPASFVNFATSASLSSSSSSSASSASNDCGANLLANHILDSQLAYGGPQTLNTMNGAGSLISCDYDDFYTNGIDLDDLKFGSSTSSHLFQSVVSVVDDFSPNHTPGHHHHHHMNGKSGNSNSVVVGSSSIWSPAAAPGDEYFLGLQQTLNRVNGHSSTLTNLNSLQRSSSSSASSTSSSFSSSNADAAAAAAAVAASSFLFLNDSPSSIGASSAYNEFNMLAGINGGADSNSSSLIDGHTYDATGLGVDASSIQSSGLLNSSDSFLNSLSSSGGVSSSSASASAQYTFAASYSSSLSSSSSSSSSSSTSQTDIAVPNVLANELNYFYDSPSSASVATTTSAPAVSVTAAAPLTSKTGEIPSNLSPVWSTN